MYALFLAFRREYEDGSGVPIVLCVADASGDRFVLIIIVISSHEHTDTDMHVWWFDDPAPRFQAAPTAPHLRLLF